MLGEVDVGELELWSDEDSEGPTTPRADLGRGTGLEARTRVRHPRSTSKPDPWLNGGRLECAVDGSAEHAQDGDGGADDGGEDP